MNALNRVRRGTFLIIANTRPFTSTFFNLLQLMNVNLPRFSLLLVIHKWTCSRSEQSSKARGPTLSTWDCTSNVLRLEHCPNALCPICRESCPPPPVTRSRLRQSLNAASPRDWMRTGNAMQVSAVQFIKACKPILFSDAGNSTLFKCLQLQNARGSISTTPSGTRK